ncbi:putative ribonuclease H-like domain-containing protein [Tanacetum coccineum]
MDLVSAQNNTIAKLPLLKQGDYEMWRLRIEQYIQLQDYALWEIIENGNIFIPVARTTTHADGTSTSTIPGPLTAEERTLKRNDDAKTLFEAIQSRFGGNDATKKIKKTLLKQTYEKFNASSSESLDSIFNKLQKIVSQLSILGVNISQEDLNLKFLRCLPVEWNTHVVIWRNKTDLETMSIDDLYNNFKIVEQEVKGFVSSSSTTGSHNMAFVSTPGSKNEYTAHIPVSTAGTPVSATSTSDSAASLSDAIVYAFLANQPNRSQIVHEDLEQIHDDHLEKMDLKWQLALLSMRAKKFYQRTKKKITINGGDTVGFDKTKVECFNCHKLGHFARECRNPRGQDGRARSYDQGSRNQEITRRTVKVEEASPKAIFRDNNKKGLGYNVVPPPLTGLFVPPSIDLSHSSIEKFKEPEFVSYGVKVSDCKEDEIVLKVVKYVNVQQKPKQANQPRNASQIPRYNRENKIELDSKRLGVGFQFSKRARFVCRSFNHQIKDCNYHDKKMGQKPILNKGKKGTGERESKPVWNDAMRTNLQNFSNNRRNFSPKAVLTKSGKVPISTARQSSPRAAVPISTAKPVNTVAPKSLVNVAKYRTNVFQKRHSPTRRLVHQETALKNRNLKNKVNTGDPQVALKDTGIFDSGCSRHMTGNKSFLTNYQEYDGGFVAFAGSSKGGKISGKGTIRTGNLDFEDVYFVKELKFNLFSVSRMCDKNNSVLFTKTECLILSLDFKLPDENQVMLKIPRKDNMYSFDLKNIVPSKGLTCLIAKAINNESKLWHRRLGHIHFKTLNKLVKGNLVRGLPSKIFENDHTCVACQKRKQYKATCKSKLVTSISQPFQILHMDLFGPTFVKSLMGKIYCLVITDDYSRFSWVFFLAKKDETSGLKGNTAMLELHSNLELLKERIGLLFRQPELCRPPIISFMRPFGYPVSILNTLDHLGKFDGKADEGVLVGYSISSKAFRVYNHRTRKVEENLHVNFLENQPNIAENEPKWLFDIDSLTNTMNYHPISAGNRANVNAGIETNSDAGQAEKEKFPDQEYILLPLLHTSSYGPSTSKEDVSSPNDDDASKKMVIKHSDNGRSQFEEECDAQLCKGMRTRTSSPNSFNTVRTPLNTTSASRTSYPAGTSSEPQLMPIDGSFSIDINDYPDDPLMPELEDTAEIHSTGIFGSAYDDSPNTPIDDQSVGAEADFNNMEPSINVSPIPTTRIHSIHPKDQIIGDPKSAVQTRRMAKKSEAGLKVNQALDDESWVEAMQEELLQFKLLNVWTLVDLPKGKKAIEEGIDYDEVFAPVVRIEAIRLFLAYASYMDFTVYQMDVKSAFLYDTIKEEVYVNQPLGFEDPKFPNKVYKVEKALYGLHQAPRAWYETLLTYLLENRFRREQRKNGIFLSQDKYVYEILKKFGFTTVKTTSTPMETHKSLSSNAAEPDVDVHLYRSMIGTLMYLTSSRPEIMFAVCVCSKFQVTLKVSHMHAVKRIFRYLKGKPTLGLWYPKDSPMDLIAYSDSDYAGASIDRKSTTGGCQFLGSRLVSWQCKKQTIVANSTTEAEYIAASHCCGQVLWLQNQLLDYGYNFMRTKIHIDNESTISVIKNPVSHSKTKHIEIRFHFIRDSYEKKLIEMVKIHTDNNVADLLTKAFDVTRFEFLIASIVDTLFCEPTDGGGVKIDPFAQVEEELSTEVITINESMLDDRILLRKKLVNHDCLPHKPLGWYSGAITRQSYVRSGQSEERVDSSKSATRSIFD